MSIKTLNGKQLKICCNIYDLNISHVDRNMVTSTITCIKFIYIEMYGSQGKRHDYLIIWLGFSSKGEVKVSMEEYLNKVINEVP